jgi:two-component system chemotaxis response regulator CheY
VADRVLIVEDSSAMRAFLRAALEDGACEVIEAASGFEALRVLPRYQFDLVIVDINMPDINGLEVVSFMRRTDAHKATRIIIISTEASERDRQKGLSLGADAYLKKPFEAEELRRLMEQVQAKHG